MTSKVIAPGAGYSARGRGCLPGRAGTLDIPENQPLRQSEHRWHITTKAGASFSIEAPGRLGWALTVLREAGERGVTTADLPPGLRWSAYIHKLRALGVPIHTTREANCGPMGGHHARYSLGCRVKREGET